MYKFFEKIYNKLYFKYLISILWTITISILSLARMPSTDDTSFNIPHLDKLVHFSMYFIYTNILLWESRQKKQKSITILIMLYCTLFGILMEILQSTIFTYRSGDFFDFVANTIGVITAYFSFSYIAKFIKP